MKIRNTAKRMGIVAASLILVLALCATLTACGHTHEFGEWTETAAATCTADGSQERVCECGEKETKTVAAAGHSFGEWTATADVSCTEVGVEERSCTVCGETETQTAPAKGHSFQAATFTAPKTCTVCGETEGEPIGTVIAAGDELSGEDFSFVLDEVYFTEKISEKHGNITYSMGGNGGYYLVLKLNFTNLATEALDDYNSDRFGEMELVYNDKYEYEGDYNILADDIVPLDSGYVYVYYTVPESMETDESASITASFDLDGELYVVLVREGDGSAPAAGAENVATDQTAELTVGDVRGDGEKSQFTLEEVYFTSKISEKHGNVTYSLGGDGKFYLVLKLNFTNLDTEVLQDYGSDRFSDMELVYNDKYEYEGDFNILADDIVPLASGYVYVYFEIPESIENDSGSLIASFSLDGADYTVDCRAA